MPPLVLTGFCCGTAFDSSAGDLIADLHRRTATDANHWKAIFAGPGSGHIQSRLYNPLSGADLSGEGSLVTYAKAFFLPQQTSRLSMTVQQGLSSSLSKQFKVNPILTTVGVQLLRMGVNFGRGLGLGEGMSINVNFLLGWVARALAVATGPVTLNLVGWSRGGVTCHLMANAVYKRFRHLSPTINIFAIDPVPGDFNVNLRDLSQYFDPDYTRLPTCVAEYRSIVMTNARTFFMPVIPLSALANTTHFEVLYVPGDHGTAVVPAVPWQINTPGTVLLTNWLVENFLLACGTTFTAQIPRSKFATLFSVDRARRMGKYDRVRRVWFMVRPVSLPNARLLSAFLHPTGQEWFPRLMQQLLNDFQHISLF